MYVWKITRDGMGGTLYLESLAEFEDSEGGAEGHGTGTKLTIEVIEMDEGEFRNLPEFECFE